MSAAEQRTKVMTEANNLIYEAAVAATELPSVSENDVAEILERAAAELRRAE